jgi:CDP-diacylglycerol--serine O-phosphatidyltransferase
MKHIPNTITCLNLFCGCLSIVSAFNGKLDLAAYFIVAAAVFDFFDGFAARRLNAHSLIGKDLDSLADMVSFGVAPASIMYMLMISAIAESSYKYIIAAAAYVIAVFSALRLAKFNNDTRQSDSFIGLPTPANALFICSLAFADGNCRLLPVVGNVFFLLAITLVFSLLLVAELPLFSLKFKSFDWKSNKLRYVFVVISAFILLILQGTGFAAVILIYILLSIFNRKRKVST